MEESSQRTDMLKKKKRKNDIIQRQTLVLCSSAFIKQSLEFIYLKMFQNKLSIEKGYRYIKEILHGIFFICYIYKPPIHPRDILQTEMYSDLSKEFPDVFQSYTSQLPRRPPFSVLLEVVVETTGDRDVSDVLEVLANLNNNMVVPGCSNNIFDNVFCLWASVVSYSYFERNGQKTQNYFGASMSCKGRTATRIFIYLACIETWNDNVTHAVCLAEKHNMSIMWPDTVHSTAYRLCLVQEGEKHSHIYKPVPPCSLCKKIFPNVKFSPSPEEDQGRTSWNYGNCAECEAISNLLNRETSVSELTQGLNTGLEPSLEMLRRKLEEQLRGHLQSCNVVVKKDSRFYNP